uniref:Cullin family profile domain-containing protein n=1 Tax=Timspurckia oligopyrenoides TaxID=708627 RepID=A0A7S1EQY9_9RHOD
MKLIHAFKPLIPQLLLAACGGDEELARIWTQIRQGLSVIYSALCSETADQERSRFSNNIDASAELGSQFFGMKLKTQPLSAVQWTELYTLVYQVYAFGSNERRLRLFIFVRDLFTSLIVEQRESMQGLTGIELLREYHCWWFRMVHFASFVKRLFSYMHRYWIRYWTEPETMEMLKTERVRGLEILMMLIWREQLLAKLPELFDAVLEFIEEDRNGSFVDASLIRSFADSLVSIGEVDLAAAAAELAEKDDAALVEQFERAEGEDNDDDEDEDEYDSSLDPNGRTNQPANRQALATARTFRNLQNGEWLANQHLQAAIAARNGGDEAQAQFRIPRITRPDGGVLDALEMRNGGLNQNANGRILADQPAVLDDSAVVQPNTIDNRQTIASETLNVNDLNHPNTLETRAAVDRQTAEVQAVEGDQGEPLAREFTPEPSPHQTRGNNEAADPMDTDRDMNMETPQDQIRRGVPEFSPEPQEFGGRGDARFLGIVGEGAIRARNNDILADGTRTPATEDARVLPPTGPPTQLPPLPRGGTTEPRRGRGREAWNENRGDRVQLVLATLTNTLQEAQQTGGLDGEPNDGRAQHADNPNEGAENAQPSADSISADVPIELEFYVREFEDRYVAQTLRYYSTEAEKFLSKPDCTVSGFTSHIIRRRTEETLRVQRFLHSCSEARVLKTVESVLVKDHLEYLLSELTKMVRNRRTEDLSKLYISIHKFESGLAKVREEFRNFVIEEGSQTISSHIADHGAFPNGGRDDLGETIFLVDKLLDLIEEHSDTVRSCFQNNALFNSDLDDAFTMFLNKRWGNHGFSEILAFYCDFLMRHGADKISESLLELRMECVVKLFAYLENKDTFHEFYRRMLSRRLLERKCNEDLERALLSKLKIKAGPVFTSMLVGMLKDMVSSKDLNNNYARWLEQNRSAPRLDTPELCVHVLNSLYWPQFKTDDLKLVESLATSIADFRKFYESITSSRKLIFVSSQSNCVMSVNLSAPLDSREFVKPGKGPVSLSNFKLSASQSNAVASAGTGSVSPATVLSTGKKTFEMVVTVHQACALVLLNQADSFSLYSCAKALGLRVEEVRTHLEPLTIGKYNILSLSDNGHSRDFITPASQTDSIAPIAPTGATSLSPRSQVKNEQPTNGALVDASPAAEPPPLLNGASESLRLFKSTGLTWMTSAAAAVMGPLSKTSAQNSKTNSPFTPGGDIGSFSQSDARLLQLSKSMTYYLNADFTPKSVRLIVPSSTPRFVQREAKQAKKQVEMDRGVQIDAAIVRILKSRRRLTHTELVSELIAQLSSTFNPDIKLIKKRLEHLIESEYIERDTEDPSVYKYIA